MFGGYYTGQPYAGQSDGMIFTVDLVLADALQGQTSDNILLTQQHLLSIANALHSIIDDGPLVLIEAKTLVVSDAAQDHTAESVALIQQHMLAIADALHAHTADSVSLIQQHLLTINDALQAQLADNVSVTISSDLIVQSALQGITSDNVVISVLYSSPPRMQAELFIPRIEVSIQRVSGSASSFVRPRNSVIVDVPRIEVKRK